MGKYIERSTAGETEDSSDQRPHKTIKTSKWTAQEEDGRFFEEHYLLDMLLHDLSTNVNSGLENISSKISKKPVLPSNNESVKQIYLALPAPCLFASRNLMKPMASSKGPEMILHTSYRAMFNKAIGPTAYM
eukprot:CAMPEP_0172184424 /NCGR_PEP_ID=MMETSP1050-20130122/19572_1 /TAXON_ID=233186 /ORGANISM="Cryptomonas curvata, Strain CCAP979/52" /LENGTH=131 /DNA_ID=CAMNT_0012858229 /DNA_START=71 /DNA_END=466 /DNA_ORIENTATION=+